MGIYNQGNQIILTKYETSIDSATLNRWLENIIDVGVYNNGLKVEKTSSTTVKISAGDIIIKDLTGVNGVVKISFRNETSSLTIPDTLTNYYVVCEWEYKPFSEWFAEIKFIVTPNANHVVLGRCICVAGEINSIDESDRENCQTVSQLKTEVNNTYLKLNGGTLTGPLFINGNLLNNVFISLKNTSATLNNKRWDIKNDNNGILKFQTLDDSDVEGTNVFAITRNSNNITGMYVGDDINKSFYFKSNSTDTSYIKSNLNIGGDSDITEKLRVEGNTTINGITTINDNTTINGNITAKNFAPTNEIFGLKLENTLGSENTNITFYKGWCFDDTVIDNPLTSKIIMNNINFRKRLNETFTEGSNQGMLQGDPVTKYLANESYLIYSIMKDDGTNDFLAVLRTDTVSLPTGFTRKRRIGIIMTDASKNIVQFNHYPKIKTYYWKNKFSVIDWQIPTTETAVAIEVPKGVSVIPMVNITYGMPNGNAAISIRGIERNYSDFNQAYCMHSGYNAELGVCFHDNTQQEHISETLKTINFITTTNGELYFQRKGSYLNSGYYSTRQVYGFVDFDV